MEIDKRISYTAADTIPLKLLLDTDLLEATRKGRILPLHVQFIPTNKCNLHCEFCSCSERDKQLEMALADAFKVIDTCKKLGTKAVTITGGGEPLLYPHINELIDYFHENYIKIGLVTNGTLLYKLHPKSLQKITWCRISSGDDRLFNLDYHMQLDKVVKLGSNVDWAFSHVVSAKPNMGVIRKVVEFANSHHFTHVRLVSDLYIPEQIDMDKIRSAMEGVSDKLVIYQGRKNYTHGGDCYICYLKPFICPDMKLYTCCGAQYALADSKRDMPAELCLGEASDMEQIMQRSNKPFNGRICVKCYYQNYNDLLGSLLKDIEHKEFV